jgi:Restriction endonuclease
MTEGLVNAYRRRRSNPRYLRYREALQLHELYKSTAQKAAHGAEQAFLRKKRSYWEFLDGYAFERATAEVLKKHQFNPIVTPGSADGGIDIEVTRNGLKGVVQCKAHVASVGPHIVRDLYGAIHHCGASFGIIVSRGGFSRGAIAFARDKPILFLNVSDLIAMQEGVDVLREAFTPKTMLPVAAAALALLYAVVKPLSDGLFDTSMWVAKVLMPADTEENETTKQSLKFGQAALMEGWLSNVPFITTITFFCSIVLAFFYHWWAATLLFFVATVLGY